MNKSKNLQQLLQYLQNRLEEPLPGVLAHQRMAPLYRPVRLFHEEDYPQARKASVLVLLYERNEVPHFVLMERASYEGVHSKQVSFPGGKSEKEDESHWHTAIRETEEEIGVASAGIQYVAALSNVYIPPSNFFVRPFLGYCTQELHFSPDPKEVANLIEVPLSALKDPANQTSMRISRPEGTFEVPCYKLADTFVWGATAIILAELEDLLKGS